MKKAKLKAVEEGISLRELFTRSLENEITGSTVSVRPAPWKRLERKGSAADLDPEASGFADYSGPDWNFDIQVNEPDE